MKFISVCLQWPVWARGEIVWSALSSREVCQTACLFSSVKLSPVGPITDERLTSYLYLAENRVCVRGGCPFRACWMVRVLAASRRLKEREEPVITLLLLWNSWTVLHQFIQHRMGCKQSKESKIFRFVRTEPFTPRVHTDSHLTVECHGLTGVANCSRDDRWAHILWRPDTEVHGKRFNSKASALTWKPWGS